MEQKIVLNVEYKMGPGGADGFVRELTQAGILDEIRSHRGCLKYDYYKAMDSDDLLLVEWWSDQRALDEHQISPCMATLRKIKGKYASSSTLERYTL
jgi:quinol monooxygenase YgiN